MHFALNYVKTLSAVFFVIRFIPGFVPLNDAGGFFAIPLPTFLFAVISATAIWTGIVFSAIYYLGTSAWLQASEYQWIIILCAIALYVCARAVHFNNHKSVHNNKLFVCRNNTRIPPLLDWAQWKPAEKRSPSPFFHL